jgi:hypothetical protein
MKYVLSCLFSWVKAGISKSVFVFVGSLKWETGQLIGIAVGYRLDDRGFESRQGLRIFLFTTVSVTALEPTQPPVQWVPGAISVGVKRPERETDNSPPTSAEVNNARSYNSTPQ